MPKSKQTSKKYFYASAILLVAILVCLAFEIVSMVSINSSRVADSSSIMAFKASFPLLFLLGVVAVVVGARGLSSMKKSLAWSKTSEGWVYFAATCLGVFSVIVTLLLLVPTLLT